ncbi:MAG: hypothetical protein IJK64_10535 [Clostridia bacterium]|nr:hypothetical protein [Clostridia bacterium]
MKAEQASGQVSALLTQWCDALVRLQVELPDARLDGGILCPACGMLHGRSFEAVYPLLHMAHRTGRQAYLTAAKRLFAWERNLRSGDGGSRNDFKSDWKGVTAFAAIALCDALDLHGDLLPPDEIAAWEARLSEMGAWLAAHLTEQTPAYLNYYAANACAMALLGRRASNDAYLALAKRLAAHCLRHVSESGLIYGEGSPTTAVSPKGCLAIDLGYNAEETLPCLTRYAAVTGDTQAQARCIDLWRAQLLWMLPDGAWDNSVGTRAFKWTYWGSRTADGCQAALFALGQADPVFAEAAWRNFALLRDCTHDGLLAGGPDYARAGEPLCVHHTICHAKTLAAALDAGIPSFPRVPLPSEQPAACTQYPELDVFRLAAGAWRMDVSGYDFQYRGASHAAGGCISLLWHADAGPLIAVGMVEYALREPHNQQLSLHPETHRCVCPRLEATVDGRRFSQTYCAARLSRLQDAHGTGVHVEAALCGRDGEELPDGACTLDYLLTENALTVRARVQPAVADRACFVLPLIGKHATVRIEEGTLQCAPANIFNLSPGFLATEYRIAPEPDGRLCFTVGVEQKG